MEAVYIGQIHHTQCKPCKGLEGLHTGFSLGDEAGEIGEVLRQFWRMKFEDMANLECLECVAVPHCIPGQ